MLILTTLLYRAGLHGPFVLDDRVNVQESYVESFDRDEVLYQVTHNRSGALGRPVSVLSFISTGLMHGPEPWGYKYHNLMLHLLNGVLLFWLLIRLLPYLNRGHRQETVLLIAGTTAAIWLLHPLMVSTVLYVVQRMAQLSVLFTLASLIVYTFTRESMKGGAARYYSLVFLALPFCLLLAVLSKENGALAILYIFAIEAAVYRFQFDDKQEKVRLLFVQLMFCALPVVLGGIYLITHIDQLANYALRDFNMWERLMTQSHVLLFYVKLILVPVVSDMSLYHDSWPVVRELSLMTVLLMLFWCGMAVIVILSRKKAPVVSLGLAWFLISHLLESTIFNLEMVFEHRNYLAAAGLLIIPVYYLFSIQKKRYRVVVVAILGLLAVMTHARALEWQSRHTFYPLAIQDHPDSYRANTEYANYQMGLGNREIAVRHLEIAQEIDAEDYGAVLHNIAMVCRTSEDVSMLYSRAIERAETYPVSVYSLNAIDRLITLVNREECQALTRGQLLSLIEIMLQQSDNQNNKRYLSFLKRYQGLLYFFNGDFGLGVDAFTEAYNISKNFTMLAELAEILLQLGQIESAKNVIGTLNEINKDRFGLETYKVSELEKKLSSRVEEKEPVGNSNLSP